MSANKLSKHMMDTFFRVNHPELTHQGGVYLRKLGPHAKNLERSFVEKDREEEKTTGYWPVVEVTNCFGVEATEDSPAMFSVEFSTPITAWSAPSEEDMEIGTKCVLVFLPANDTKSGSACWVVRWEEFEHMASVITADAPEGTFDTMPLREQLVEAFPVGENTFKLISSFYDNKATMEMHGVKES